MGDQTVGSITASYASGPVAVSSGVSNVSGALVGGQGGSITASYGFGAATSGTDGSINTIGAPPAGASVAAELTLALAGSSWNAAADRTQGAWDFGTASQLPLLRYADYDGGGGNEFACSQFPGGICGALVPGQLSLDVGEQPARGAGVRLTPGRTVQLSASFADDRAAIASWRWQQLSGPPISLSGAASPQLSFTAPNGADVLVVLQLTAVDAIGREYGRRLLSFSSQSFVDGDGDGLIDIDNLTMLHNMRYNLAGTSYKTSATATGVTSGCPQDLCTGYELIRDLDFDFDGDGSSWSVDGSGVYSLDAGDSQAPWFEVANGGWLPIGSGDNAFTTVFDGNGYVIRNLAIRRSGPEIGLFSAINAGAAIRNLGLIDNLADHTGNSDSTPLTGGLVGWQRGGSITASHATGDVYGTSRSGDRIGVLVGRQSGGSITASYATGNVGDKSGSSDIVGALVGWLEAGSITASYATGNAAGGDGGDTVGALVGRQDAGSIVASYATGNADGEGGVLDNVGALVGRQQGGSITASYATGNANGGDRKDDSAGALVGRQDDDAVITASYGFGAAVAEILFALGPPPEGVTRATLLTAANAGASWNAAANDTLGAWDFGSGDQQQPALRYADYDGAGTDFACSQFPAGACGTLVPGQPFLLADADGDGLIEIRDLTMLHNMRYNLAGTSYKSGTIAIADSSGCPAAGCNGYELTGDLDFDADGDGSSWTGDSAQGYRLDPDDSRAPWFVVDEDGTGGWLPVGDNSNQFTAVFDGNGYAIRNLAIRRDQPRIGLFGVLGGTAAIRNLGLVANLANSFRNPGAVGGLVGEQEIGSSITASYATGPVVAVGGSRSIGGLVGDSFRGLITASYATGPVVAGSNRFSNWAGGLVGTQSGRFDRGQLRHRPGRQRRRLRYRRLLRE